MNTEENLLVEISKLLGNLIQNFDIDPDEDLLASGKLTSLTSMNLIVAMEETFGITIPNKELNRGKLLITTLSDSLGATDIKYCFGGKLMAIPTPSPKSGETPVKCLVWDLDQTLWNGVLSEGDPITIKPECRALIKALDDRGVLQSIASKNEASEALAILKKEELHHYFLYPQINWNPKSSSIQSIAKALNIGADSIAFIDDQNYEREEVTFAVPEIRVYSAEQACELDKLPEFSPSTITEDATLRRQMYQEDQQRKDAESAFKGPNDSFLRSLKMKMHVSLATDEDLDRLSELTQRTHQLNTTGISFSQPELQSMLHDPAYKLLVVSLDDRFGSYGKIGLVVIRKSTQQWCIKLLLLSCRVMTRGIGNALIAYLKTQALEEKVQLHADFKETDRNRMMYITYKFAGFEEIDSTADPIQLRCDLSLEFSIPDTIKLSSDG